ncbi:MAG: hypothetical protein ACREER_02940 [Alphaproteobacteria bacterium]
MMVRLVSALFVVLALAAPAVASQCPSLVKRIDEAVAAGTSLSAEDLAKVKTLRDEGEALHAAGSHADSVARLQEALALLGL